MFGYSMSGYISALAATFAAIAQFSPRKEATFVTDVDRFIDPLM